MLVRKRINRSGSISVVVIDKANGKYTEIKKFGVAKSEEEADELFKKAHSWLRAYGGQLEFDFDNIRGKEMEETARVVENMDTVLINGTQLLLNRIYDRIGFGRIPDDILRHLVIARISQPMSKLATTEYLKSYYDEDVDLNRIYRYMDKLYNTQMELAQQISVEHTRKVLGARIKSESADVRRWMLSLDKESRAVHELERQNGERLIVSYSEKRARKDAYNRARGVARLRKAYRTGHITKQQVSRRGYNKFLEISRNIDVAISEEKIAEDSRWGWRSRKG